MTAIDPQEGELKCESCGQCKPDVRERACGYAEDIAGTIVLEVICDDCEWQHLGDI